MLDDERTGGRGGKKEVIAADPRQECFIVFIIIYNLSFHFSFSALSRALFIFVSSSLLPPVCFARSARHESR
jgi:hypothetical protein